MFTFFAIKKLVLTSAILIGVVFAIDYTSQLSGNWVIEHRPLGTIKTMMRDGEWTEVLEYNTDDALIARHWRDSKDRPNMTTYDPATGDEVSHDVME